MEENIFLFSMPIRVYWDITYKCNLKCIHCYSRPESSSAQELSESEAKRLAIEIAKEKVFYVNLAGGEPVMRPDFEEILRILSEGAVRISIATNGYFIDKNWVNRLQNYNLDHISISIDGANASTHDYIRGKDGSFDTALGAVKILKEAGIKTFISMVLTKINVNEVIDFFDMGIALGVDGISTWRCMNMGYCSEREKELIISDEEHKMICERLASKPDKWKKRINYYGHDFAIKRALSVNNNFIKPTRGICQAAKSLCYINPTGIVYPCILIRDKVLGNVKEYTLREVWLNDSRDILQKDIEKNFLSIGDCPSPHFK